MRVGVNAAEGVAACFAYKRRGDDRGGGGARDSRCEQIENRLVF